MSLETQWATSAPRGTWLGSANGGQGTANQSSDDGRLNFKSGDVFSKRFEGVHGLELRKGDTGVFIRGRYWYDLALQDDSLDHRDIDNRHRQTAAQAAGSQWLDVFAYHHFHVQGQLGTVRVGRQVVRWGESQLIDGGLDAINPRDFSRFLVPGADVQEHRLPVNLLYLSQNLTSGWMLDAFYQLSWTADTQANCGTFFSTSDALPRGCSGYDVGLALSAAERAQLSDLAAAYGQGYQRTAEGVRIPRGHDQTARNTGQFGLALHGQWADWTLGIQLMKYHSRQAMMGTHSAGAATQAALADLLAATPEALRTTQAQGVLLGQARYNLRYPEDIRLYGLTFSRPLTAGSRWFGEFSYRPNAPIQLNQAELIAQLSTGTAVGADHQGYRRKPIAQWQTGLSHEIGPVMGAERLLLNAEAAYVRVMGLGERHYGRDPVWGVGGHKGFVTSEAWGYRMRVEADYGGWWPKLRVQPRVAFAQDVQGYGPNGSFYEGAKALTLGIKLDYLDAYTLDMAYSSFWGGRYNPLVDRDFARLQLGVRF